MPSGNKWLRVAAMLASLSGVAGSSSWQEMAAGRKRPVTVADVIGMTRIAGSQYPAVRPKRDFAVFSPDGKRFVIVLSKGNLGKNTNDYSLLLFRTANVFRNAAPTTLALFSSSSNRMGISDLTWSEDNDTIFFLGAQGAEPAQLYSIRSSSRELKKLTNHSTSLISYATARHDESIVYSAEKPERDLISANSLRHGIQIGTESLSDLIRGRIGDYEPDLFVKQKGRVAEKRLQTRGLYDNGINNLFLSPDGRYLVLRTDTTEIPESWRRYEDPAIQMVLRHALPKGAPTRILRYEIVDLRTGRSEVLLNSPATYPPCLLWSPDSTSLLLCEAYLPLDEVDPVELQTRRSTRFVIEIGLPSRNVAKITKEDVSPICWNSKTNTVQFRVRQSQGEAVRAEEAVYFRKTGEAWEKLADASPFVQGVRPEILAEQDLNLPPRIVAVDSQTKRSKTILDPNPQVRELALGKVMEIHWMDGAGNLVSGGLYLPPDYIAGRRYPLVIQTHGFEPRTFVMDGPHTTAAAAQPLAGRGIVVLQVKDIFYDSLNTPQEPDRAMRAYENAIEYLDRKEIIDRHRVGLAGFSRTSLYVKYTLTHSNQRFAAAIVADGFDAGYLQYIISSNTPNLALEADSVMGASPFGAGLSLWLKRSPGFLLDKVRTPLQIQALAPGSLLGEWHWFAGLKHLNRPVDMIYLPAGIHILVKPWDRMASQQGSVDWFCFWLKGEEDSQPEKAEMYSHWRELRSQLASSEAHE